MDITNQLAEETTLHWHGLEVPGEVTGPQVIAPGATPYGKFTSTQREVVYLLVLSASAWESTGRQVVTMGWPGLVLIEDESGRLLLPKQWGSMMCRR